MTVVTVVFLGNQNHVLRVKCVSQFGNLDTRDHFLAARRDSIATPLTPTNAQSGFTQISLPSHLCSPGSCVNTHRPPALNKSPRRPPYTAPLSSTGGLRWQLYKCWQSVPEQHWFCSNQSREIATHGKWHCLCAIAYISALIVAGQTRPGQTGGLVSWVVWTAGKHQPAVCSPERCGRPSCRPYLKCEWTNLILVQRKTIAIFPKNPFSSNSVWNWSGKVAFAFTDHTWTVRFPFYFQIYFQFDTFHEVAIHTSHVKRANSQPGPVQSQQSTPNSTSKGSQSSASYF